MGYDERAADRVRRALRRRRGVWSERRMFGGLCFLLDGHMCCGLIGSDLVLRLGNDGAARALLEPATRPMDFTGTPLKSMVYVAPSGYATDDALADWLGRSVRFVRSLPRKG